MLTTIFETIKKRIHCQRVGLFLIIQIVLVAMLFPGCSGSLDKASGEPQFQVRALWVDPPEFKDRETVDNLIEKCQRQASIPFCPTSCSGMKSGSNRTTL